MHLQELLKHNHLQLQSKVSLQWFTVGKLCWTHSILISWAAPYCKITIPGTFVVWCLCLISTFATYFGLCLLNFSCSDIAALLIESLHCFDVYMLANLNLSILISWAAPYCKITIPGTFVVWCLCLISTFATYFGLCLLNFSCSDIAALLIESLHCFDVYMLANLSRRQNWDFTKISHF